MFSGRNLFIIAFVVVLLKMAVGSFATAVDDVDPAPAVAADLSGAQNAFFERCVSGQLPHRESLGLQARGARGERAIRARCGCLIEKLDEDGTTDAQYPPLAEFMIASVEARTKQDPLGYLTVRIRQISAKSHMRPADGERLFERLMRPVLHCQQREIDS